MTPIEPTPGTPLKQSEQPVQLPRVFAVDFASCKDFRAFMRLYGLTHRAMVVFQPGEYEREEDRVKKCLIELPPEQVQAMIQAEVEKQRRESAKKAGLVL